MRPSFVLCGLLLVLGWLTASFMLAVDVFAPSSESLLGRDFTNLWVAGRLVLKGRLENLYDPALFRSELLSQLGIISPQNYSYPPHALLMATPFALLPYHVALLIWTVTGAAFLYWSARPYGLPWVAVATPAAAINMWAGHYGFWLGGLWLLFFRFLRPRPATAGMIAGLLTFKPHMGLFVGLVLLARRQAFVAAILTTAVLVALSVTLFGYWHEFLIKTTAAQVAVLNNSDHAFYYRLMPSAYVIYGHSTWAHAGFALAALALLARRPTTDPFALAIATFIVLPYCFNYDMTVATFGIWLLIWNDWERLSWVKRTILAVAFMSPALCIFIPLIVPPALLAALAIVLQPGADCEDRCASAHGVETEARV